MCRLPGTCAIIPPYTLVTNDPDFDRRYRAAPAEIFARARNC
jgi:hypothetical protein